MRLIRGTWCGLCVGGLDGEREIADSDVLSFHIKFRGSSYIQLAMAYYFLPRMRRLTLYMMFNNLLRECSYVEIMQETCASGR
jgi:Na+-transporting methylmalonyl-CoA/oxaloacetate decarboxylase beta subunit